MGGLVLHVRTAAQSPCRAALGVLPCARRRRVERHHRTGDRRPRRRAARPRTELPDLSGQSLTISNWDAYTPED